MSSVHKSLLQKTLRYNSCMSSSALSPATDGELLFQDYLDAMRYEYEFEKEFPGKKKRPDYTISLNGVSLFDVKDFEPNLPAFGFGAYDPYPRIRQKIDEGRQKFKEFKEYPCSLVLKNNDNPLVNLESPRIMLGSMYGDAGFTVPVYVGGGPTPSELPDVSHAFLGRGKMIRSKRLQNTTISALITLRFVAVGRRRIDRVWQEKKSNDASFRNKRIAFAYDEVCEAAAERYPNFDAEEKRLAVIVWENGVARIPLSRELFTGPYDERWGCEDGNQSIVFRGEKLSELADSNVPI